MKATDKTLIEQLKIGKHDIERRKAFLGFTDSDIHLLVSLRDLMAENIDKIVEDFYKIILPFHEVEQIIGDAETLKRLKRYQRIYVISLFSGQYDEDYVQSRLRVGIVHKRIGVGPKFYFAAIHHLSTILRQLVIEHSKNDCQLCAPSLVAIEKIIMFDLSLTFDTYIHSLLEKANRSKKELEYYVESLEEVVYERTKLLKEEASHDGLTNLLNQRSFYTELRNELSRGQRRNYSTVLIYFDIDGFKRLNDSQGHKRGDEILVAVAESMRRSLRKGEICARYGGDEFGIILPDGTLQEAEQVSQRLCEYIKISTKGSGISCSIGIAISTPENHYDADLLVKMADKAMYEAKKESGFSIKLAPAI